MLVVDALKEFRSDLKELRGVVNTLALNATAIEKLIKHADDTNRILESHTSYIDQQRGAWKYFIAAVAIAGTLGGLVGKFAR
jgi:predicted rRNA methylase YqxC with S4 and FtsJ domains